VKCRRVETAVGLDWPAILAEFHDIFSHDTLLPRCQTARTHPAAREYINRIFPHPLSALPADGLYAFDRLYSNAISGINAQETPLTAAHLKPVLIPALALWLGAVASASPAHAQSAVSEGQKLAFDRGKGNCLTCHDIKGGDLPGTIGPPLKDIKSKYPDRNELVAILTDETKRNPQTVMPPFGRNRILTEQEINAIVDFLQTL
jgi:sulfur-oxidizing protein SoxX